MHAGGEHEDGSGEENRAIHLYIMHTKTHESFVKDKKKYFFSDSTQPIKRFIQEGINELGIPSGDIKVIGYDNYE